MSPTARYILCVLVGAAITASSVAVFIAFSDTQSQVEQTEQEIQRLKALLVTEKVCSETNQGEPCRDLFNRIADSLTDAQRYRLACTVVAFLDGPVSRRIHRASNCPVR